MFNEQSAHLISLVFGQTSIDLIKKMMEKQLRNPHVIDKELMLQTCLGLFYTCYMLDDSKGRALDSVKNSLANNTMKDDIDKWLGKALIDEGYVPSKE